MLQESRATLKLKTQKLSERTFQLRLQGELDIYTVGRLEAKLKEVQEKADEVVLDLAELEFMDGAGLRAIIAADKRARSKGSSLKIVEGSPSVHKVFCLTGFDERLHFIPPGAFGGDSKGSTGGVGAV